MKKHKIAIIILILFLTTGCGKKSIIGKWKSTNKKNEYYYNFNEDKTCSYEMTVARLDCTYEINENKITILYKGNKNAHTFKYQFKGKSLIIIDDNNHQNTFIRQKKK